MLAFQPASPEAHSAHKPFRVIRNSEAEEPLPEGIFVGMVGVFGFVAGFFFAEMRAFPFVDLAYGVVA
jgi:hypothetical protein